MPVWNMDDKMVTFFADWKTRAKTQQRRYAYLAIGSFFVTFIICIISLLLVSK